MRERGRCPSLPPPSSSSCSLPLCFPPPPRLPPSFLREALPGGEPLQRGSACPGALPVLAALPSLAGRAGPRLCLLPRLLGSPDAAGASGGSSGRRTRWVSSEHLPTPRRRGRQVGSSRPSVPFTATSPHGENRVGGPGASRPGPCCGATLASYPRGGCLALGPSARAWSGSHRRASLRSLPPRAAHTPDRPKGDGSAGGRRGCEPRAGHQASSSKGKDK